jgi:hypothetical protein
MIRRWVEIWDRRESPYSLALVRIFIATVVVYDLSQIYLLDLVEPLYASVQDGGIGNVLAKKQTPILYRWFPMEAETAWLSVGFAFGSAVLFGLGFCTRISGVLFVIASANLAQILGPSDRAVDILLRNMVLVLSLSGSHRVWSIDALLRTRLWGGDGRLIPAWPRYMVVAQLFILYFSAGTQKVALSWTPMGDWSALYIVLRDPSFSVLSDGTLNRFYWVTQLGTLTTWVWEWMTPLAAYAWWCRDTRTSPGWLRSKLNGMNFWHRWVFVGMSFHIGTMLFMRLGMFPFGLLALYPAFFHPDEVRRVLRLRN